MTSHQMSPMFAKVRPMFTLPDLFEQQYILERFGRNQPQAMLALLA